MMVAIMNNLPELIMGTAWTGLVFWFGRWTTTKWARKGAKTK